MIIDILSSYTYAGNTAWQYAIALAWFFGTLLGLKIVQMVIISRLKKLANKTKTDIDDAVIAIFSGLKSPFYLVVALYVALRVLSVGGWVSTVMSGVILVVVVYEVIKAIGSLFDFGMQKYFAKEHAQKGDEEVTEATLMAEQAMSRTLRVALSVVLWSVGLLMILSNLGVNVTSLIASLGVGGIAVAFALQNVLSDLFSSFAIYLDKPFQVGDFIVVGEHSGTVKRIGLKTTRIQKLEGEELVVSNQELTSARIQNYKKMQDRRIAFSLGFVYGTPKKKLEQIPTWIEDIIKAQDNVTFDRCHFKSYGDSSLNFETIYHVNSRDYAEYMNIQQAINLALYEKFEKEKVAFAFPTQTVIVEK